MRCPMIYGCVIRLCLIGVGKRAYSFLYPTIRLKKKIKTKRG